MKLDSKRLEEHKQEAPARLRHRRGHIASVVAARYRFLACSFCHTRQLPATRISCATHGCFFPKSKEAMACGCLCRKDFRTASIALLRGGRTRPNDGDHIVPRWRGDTSTGAEGNRYTKGPVRGIRRRQNRLSGRVVTGVTGVRGNRKCVERLEESVEPVKPSWGKLNPERMRELKANWRDSNREKERERQRRVSKQKDRVKKAANMKRWRRANVAKRNASSAERRAAKLRAMPAWASVGAIHVIYKKARMLSMEGNGDYEVDHIIPLRGENVCGLHVENNLQILPSAINRAKANKF